MMIVLAKAIGYVGFSFCYIIVKLGSHETKQCFVQFGVMRKC